MLLTTTGLLFGLIALAIPIAAVLALLAVTLARRLRESFGRDPGLGAIFENPTVARLAPLMEGTGEADHGLGADVAGAVQLDAGEDRRILADGDVGADDRREPTELRVRPGVADVDHAAVLHAGARADAHVVDVASDHRRRPHRDVVAEHHVADDGRGGIDVDARAELRRGLAIRSDIHRTSMPRCATRLAASPAAWAGRVDAACGADSLDSGR